MAERSDEKRRFLENSKISEMLIFQKLKELDTEINGRKV